MKDNGLEVRAKHLADNWINRLPEDWPYAGAKVFIARTPLDENNDSKDKYVFNQSVMDWKVPYGGIKMLIELIEKWDFYYIFLG